MKLIVMYRHLYRKQAVMLRLELARVTSNLILHLLYIVIHFVLTTHIHAEVPKVRKNK